MAHPTNCVVKIFYAALSGRFVLLDLVPRAMPWAMLYWPFRPESRKILNARKINRLQMSEVGNLHGK